MDIESVDDEMSIELTDDIDFDCAPGKSTDSDPKSSKPIPVSFNRSSLSVSSNACHRLLAPT